MIEGPLTGTSGRWSGGARGNSGRRDTLWCDRVEPPGPLDGCDVGVKGRGCHGQLIASDLSGDIRGAPTCTGEA